MIVETGPLKGASLTPDRAQIYYDLIADKITWGDAAERLQKLPPSWQSKEWKANRSEVLKSACEKCGSSKEPFVIQHPYHPPSINDLIRVVAAKKGKFLPTHAEYRESLRAGQYAGKYAVIQPEKRECCPKCGSVAVRWGVTDQAWKCNGTSQNGSRRCNHDFKEPSYTVEFSPASKKAIARLNLEIYKKYEKDKKKNWEKVCRLYGKESVIESLRWSSWYLSLNDTQTYCKKCAYKEDRFFGLIGGTSHETLC